MNQEPKASDTPIDVNSDITPITQTRVEAVDASTWDTASVASLYNDLTTLQSRYYALLQMNKFEMANGLYAHIQYLKAIISNREQSKSAYQYERKRTDKR